MWKALPKPLFWKKYQDTQKCNTLPLWASGGGGLWEDPKARLAGQSTMCQISTTKYNPHSIPL